MATTMQNRPQLITTVIITAICAVVILLAGVLAAQQPSTAIIRCQDRDGAMSQGSGVLIAHGKAGWSLVATNAHVVQSTRDGGTSVQFPGVGSERRTAKVVAFNRADDVAILGIPTPEGIVPSQLDLELSPGRRVTREGFARGRFRATQGTVLRVSGHYAGSTAPIHRHTPGAIEGESGGPVRGMDGRLVGLVATTDSKEASGPTSRTIYNTVPVQWQPQCIPCQPIQATIVQDDIPPAPPIPKSDQTPTPKPQQVVDYEALAAAIIKEMASDPRFRGPTGPAGPSGKSGLVGKTGPSGPRGADGRDHDPAKIVAINSRLKVAEDNIKRIYDLYNKSTFDVEVVTPGGEVLTGAVHAHGGLLRLNLGTN